MKPKLTRKARKALVDAALDILREPELYDQKQDRIPDASCGSRGCIFGFVALRLKIPVWNLFTDVANKLLLDCEGGWLLGADAKNDSVNQAARLFYYWPDEWDELYKLSETDQERAAVACGRICHFLKTGE